METTLTQSAKEIVGTKIKTLRKQKNMTQQQLADLLGVDRQYVWNVENGNVNLTMEYLDRIAIALQVPISEFINTNI